MAASTPQRDFDAMKQVAETLNYMWDEDVKGLLPGLQTGSAPAIWELSNCMLTPSSCPSELLPMALSPLDPRRVPNMEQGGRAAARSHAHVQPALACLAVLNKMAITCSDTPDMRSIVVPALIGSLDGALEWIQFCLDYHVLLTKEPLDQGQFSLCPYAQLMITIIFVDPLILPILMQSKKFLVLVIRIWATSEYYVPWDEPATCPALGLLCLVVTKVEGRKALVEELLLQDLAIVGRFAASTVARAKAVSDAAKVRNCPDGLEVYTSKLIQAVALICGTELGKHILHQHFVDAGCIRVLATLLENLTSYVGPRGKMASLLPPVAALLTIATAPNRFIVRSVSELLDSGFLVTHTVVLAATNSRGTGKVLKTISQWTTQPTVLRVLCKKWAQKGWVDSLERFFSASHDKEAWGQFRTTTTRRVTSYSQFRASDPRPICDNLACSAYTKPTRRSESWKQCSQCSSVAYCCPECQREDWHARHRKECLSARKESQELRESGSWYSHHTRSFHLSYLLSVHTSLSQIPRLVFGDVLPVFDCTSTPEVRDMVYLKALQHEKPPLAQSFREDRLQELCQKYTSCSLPATTRLVQGIFANGPKYDIHLTVMLKVDPGATSEGVEAVYSVPCLRKHERDP